MSLPDRPSLEQLRKQAKDLLRLARAGDAIALTRIATKKHAARDAQINLAHAQILPVSDECACRSGADVAGRPSRGRRRACLSAARSGDYNWRFRSARLRGPAHTSCGEVPKWS